MENAVEALKIAFGVMIFVLALSMSISCFSQMNSAVQAIVTLRDRETEYTYVEQSQGTRTVGIETIIPTMYRVYKENIEIYFLKADGTQLPLYYATSEQEGIVVNYIGSNNKYEMKLSDDSAFIEFIDTILGTGKDTYGAINNKYYNQLYYDDGIYEAFRNYEFTEELGEYEVGSGASTTTKRVITYKLTK